MSTTNLYLYLHTHWDREWYWSFAAYRTQLVSVVKDILHLLESGALDKFMLDGQTALIEDALEVSPGLATRIKALVKSGKLLVGPWYVLADQMLVGGEALVRNLHYGLELSNSLSGDTNSKVVGKYVGYCPDTFGHSADLPRILRGSGIDTAVVWRGVPKLTASPLFDWASPDGSTVLTLDLSRGYYQSAFGENLSAEAVAKNISAFLDCEIDDSGRLLEKNSKMPPGPTIIPQINGALFPVGADHVGPQADYNQQLKAALAVINKAAEAAQSDKKCENAGNKVKAETVSLAQFFEKIRESIKSAEKDSSASEPMQIIATELRDNKHAFQYTRAYMLAGVLSTRLYLKRDNRLSEQKLLRQVEPFRALLAVNKIVPYCHDEIDFNWKLLLKNQPHDSICGCSIDSVHREMQARTVSLNDSLELLTTQGKEALLKGAAAASGISESDVRFCERDLDIIDPHLPVNKLVVFNPTSSPLQGPVRLKLALAQGKKDQKLPDGFQQVNSYDGPGTFFGLSRVPTFNDVTFVEGYIDAGQVPAVTLQAVDISSQAGQAPVKKIRKGEDYPAEVVIEGKSFGGVKLVNQFFSVQFDADGALWAHVNDGGGQGFSSVKLGHRFVDLADAGDTYNFDAIANDEPTIARLVSVSAGKKGPLVSSLIAHYQIDLPEGLLEKGHQTKDGEAVDAPALTVFERSRIRLPHKIETEIILKKDVPVVFFETSMQQHRAQDHRLEVVFDLPEAVDHTLSENHFALIKRSHNKKSKLNPITYTSDIVDLGHEAPLTRYPCQRFFVAGGGTFLNTGLPEYGVGDSSVSITLLRAVSYLSRKRLRARGGGAGPILPTPEANCPGLMRTSYGWAPTAVASFSAGHKVSDEAAPYILADIYEGQLLAFTSPGGGVADKSLSLFAVDHPDIRVTATYIDSSERLVIRLLNPTSKSRTVHLSLPQQTKSACLADFNGKTNELALDLKKASADAAASSVTLDFKPCQLLTVFCKF